MKTTFLSDRDFAITVPPQQFVNKVSHRNAAVTRELKTPEDVH
jgi:hypothetical protein